MLSHEDLKWIASTSTDLNSVLQQISRYCDLARRHKGEHNYVDLLAERVELATKTAQGLFDRVTTKILASTSKGPGARSSVFGGKNIPPFTVLPPPMPRPSFGASPSEQKSNVSTKANLRGGEPGKEEADFSAADTSEIQVKNPKGNREYILVIEDEPEVAEFAAEMLAEEGYKVILAHDGFEALKIYKRMGRQIGLVILDYFLPVIDGDAVFDELRALNPDVSVVLSSGFAEQSKIASMLSQGLRGFIPKPYTRERLLEQVRSILDAAREAAFS
jgi:CheY-like chemotaxis protein